MFSPSPTRPLPGPTPPTPVQSQLLEQVFPRFTDPSQYCPPTPNEVAVALTTTLIIPDYARYYHIPISQFTPVYHALEDGSLITQPYAYAQSDTIRATFFLGFHLALFVRNVIVSGDYISRAKVKKKILFYVLFGSQILGILAAIPRMAGLFDHSVNCTAVLVAAHGIGNISIIILISGILGFKAYRCLNDSRVVLAILALFSTGSIVFLILDLVSLRGHHRLTGGCVRIDMQGLYTRVYLLNQLAEILSITLCFLSAVWKSKDSPLIRGRMSIRLSMGSVPEDNDILEKNGRRGWWDYVPKQEADTVASSPSARPSLRTFLTTIKAHLSRVFPSTQPMRKSSIHSDSAPGPQETNLSGTNGRQSMASSSYGRIGRYIPRMELFRGAMQDELCYTALISALCVVVTTFAVVGSSFPNQLNLLEWIDVNWMITSILSIHSFGRVVRRSEREQAQGHYARTADFATHVQRTPVEPNTAGRTSQRSRYPGRGFDEQENQRLRTATTSRQSWNSISTISSTTSITSPPVVICSPIDRLPSEVFPVTRSSD